MKPFMHYLTLWGAAVLSFLFLFVLYGTVFLLPLSHQKPFATLFLQAALAGCFCLLWASRYGLTPDAPRRGWRQAIRQLPFRLWAFALVIPAFVLIYVAISF